MNEGLQLVQNCICMIRKGAEQRLEQTAIFHHCCLVPLSEFFHTSYCILGMEKYSLKKKKKYSCAILGCILFSVDNVIQKNSIMRFFLFFSTVNGTSQFERLCSYLSLPNNLTCLFQENSEILNTLVER